MNKYAHANGQIIDTEAQEIILGGDAVADRLNALEAERDALRNALQHVYDYTAKGHDIRIIRLHEVAQRALTEGGNDGK